MAMHRRLQKEIPMLKTKTLLNDGLALEDSEQNSLEESAANAGGRSGRGGSSSSRGGGANGVSFVMLLAGPRDSPYEGGVFRLQVAVPPQYPLEPPKMKFETRIYHPNVGRGHTPGAICLDILRKEAWSPALTLERTLISIASLLADPNPSSPMDGEAARLYSTNRPAYDRRVREWVNKYARPQQENADADAGSEPGDAWVGDFGKEATESKAEGDGSIQQAGSKPDAVRPEVLDSAATAPPAAPVTSDTKADVASAAPRRSSSLAEEIASVVIDLEESDDDTDSGVAKKARVA